MIKLVNNSPLINSIFLQLFIKNISFRKYLKVKPAQCLS